MEQNILTLAKITFLDKMLDDFEDELGDLPKSIKIKEASISDKKFKISETEDILNDIKVFVSSAKTTLVALKEKEDKLIRQQFLVRNNKEFDAISNEVKALKIEHEKLAIKMRTEGQKENNLIAILEEQKKELETLVEELTILNVQFNSLIEEHSSDIKKYTDTRKILRDRIQDELYSRYATIRKQIPDAAVYVRKSSCMGCYRQIPKQIIVEMRNQTERIFQCEHCGRLLIPDWVSYDENNLI